MSIRATSENFENDRYYQMYLDQLSELMVDPKFLPVYFHSSSDVFRVSANLLRKPMSQELSNTLKGLMKYAQYPNDIEVVIDQDGFDVFVRKRINSKGIPSDRGVESIVRSAVREFFATEASSEQENSNS